MAKSIRENHSVNRQRIVIRLLLQHVADAAYGVNQPGAAACLKLCAQVEDIDFNYVRLATKVVTPDTFVYPVSLQHLSRVPDEKLQKVKLLSGQTDEVVAAFNFSGC